MENDLILYKFALKNFWNVFLLTLLMFSYKVQFYYKILPRHFVLRVNYCEWCLHNMNDDILNAWFHLEGYVHS
ncbi:hypothetical protein BDFB_011988 [Asbolus verrucosus]|uniref:Uncharacterized protein n=1 Tax=Asbolus verrucosus TaxID=1661398 RepID=A0A482VU70_ASBVE|nr:hypothetical protein BDFB_011988 [Asbolus verrucosus]